MQKYSSYDITLLLEQVSLDNEAAFRKVFDHYKSPFYSVAFKMTHNSDSAEEIVQEVFVLMWLKRKLIILANSPEKYVFTILHNCIYAYLRKLAKERQLKSRIARSEVNCEDLIETRLLEKENRGFIEKVINRLPPQQKIIYKLAKQEGVSREEIARRMHISPNSVRNHLAAAVGNLRASLKHSKSAIFWICIWMQL